MPWRSGLALGRMDDAARAMGARRVSVGAETPWSGAAIDSRRVTGGELFFALPGEHTDGHRFGATVTRRRYDHDSFTPRHHDGLVERVIPVA